MNSRTERELCLAGRLIEPDLSPALGVFRIRAMINAMETGAGGGDDRDAFLAIRAVCDAVIAAGDARDARRQHKLALPSPLDVVEGGLL